jgi:hypothetical protein
MSKDTETTIYCVTYKESVTYMASVLASSEEEAKYIVRSGECHYGRAIETEFDDILNVKLA